MTEKKKPRGDLPLKERSPAQVRAALSKQPADVVNQALALHSYACKNHLGLSQLHHRTGIPTGVLSPFFNGTYTGDFSAIAERVEKFFWRLEQKELYGGIRKFVPTRIAKVLWGYFDKTRVIRRIQIIQSPEQVGKTTAAKEYTAQNNSGRTIYIQLAGATRSGCGDFIWELARVLNIPYTIKMREKRIRIKEKLESCDEVIIDEAHLIWSWADSSIGDFFDYLRTDVFDNGARGVVLIATNSDMLNGVNAFRKRRGYNIGQLLGRLRAEVIELDPAEDITEGDVGLLVSRYYKPGAKTLRMLTSLARKEQLGHFGLLQDVMNEAWTRAKAKKQQLKDSTVECVALEIMTTLKDRKELYS